MRGTDQLGAHLPADAAAEFLFGIAVSKFHDAITSKLVAAAREVLINHGCLEENIRLVEVPGAYELPFAAQELAGGDRDAVLCLGSVIRGQTPHFDYICQWAAYGIGQVGLSTGVPTVFGVITANTIEQALERSGRDSNNKGAEAALTAIQMASLVKKRRDDEATLFQERLAHVRSTHMSKQKGRAARPMARRKR